MAWKASLTVSESPDPNTLLASGTATGTDDDSGIKQVSVTLQYEDGVPSHMTVGSTFDLEADC